MTTAKRLKKTIKKHLIPIICFFLILLTAVISAITLTWTNTDKRSEASTSASNSFEAEDPTAILSSSGVKRVTNLKSASGNGYLEFTNVTTTTVPTVVPSQSKGVKYYVDCQNGKDTNSGRSETEAWSTLSKVNSATLSTGEALLFKKGCSWTGTLTVGWSGTSSSPITIGAYGSGELPIIQNSTNSTTLVKITGSFVTIDSLFAKAIATQTDSRCANNPVGFIVGFGFESGSHDNVVQNSKATGGWAGIDFKAGSSRNKALYNQIIDNKMMSVLTSGGNDDSGAFGIISHSNDNEIAYNSISGSYACSYDYKQDGAAIEIYGGSRNNVHHNKATNSDTFTELGKPSNGTAADNTYAYNSFISDYPTSIFLVTRGSGDSFGPVLRTKVYNNTTYLPGFDSSTGRGGQGIVCISCGTDILTLKNNIIWAGWKAAYASSSFNEGNNIYWKSGGSPFIQGYTPSSSSKKTDPLFVNAGGSNLHLKSTSPAVNMGSSEPVSAGYTKDLDGNTVPNGPSVDVGSYEYTGATSGTGSGETPSAEVLNQLFPQVEAQSGDTVTLVGAGDAGRCNRVEDNKTAKLVQDVINSKPSGSVRVYYGGDVYEQGTSYEMANCYGGAEYGYPAWGSFKSLTWPVIGDHEQQSSNGNNSTLGYSYYNYWGYPPAGQSGQLGERYKGWYSKDFGAWHLVFLDITNRSCTNGVPACNVGSEQYNWFKSDLEKNAANGDKPTIVVMHHTYWRVSSTTGRDIYRPLIDLMYQYGVEVLLQHDTHNFQAFNPMKPDSSLDPSYGIRAFVTGFGGAPTVTSTVAMPGDRVAHTNFTAYGVLEFTLSPSSYSWKMHTINNTDSWSGSSPVHGKPGSPIKTPTPTASRTPSPSPTATPPSGTFTLTPVADTYVTNETPAKAATNYGSASFLAVDSSYSDSSYLKFDTKAFAGKTLTEANLKLKTTTDTYSGSPSINNIKLVENTSWTESGMTYLNKPVMSTPLGTLSHTVPNTSYEVTLDASVLQKKLGDFISIGIDTTSRDGLFLNSRESPNVSDRPQLVLKFSTQPSGCSAPPTDTGTATLKSAIPAGTYRVWSRVMGSGSYFLQPGTECVVQVRSTSANTWNWVSNTIKVSVPATTLKLIGKENGVRVDRILFDSGACIPVDKGDNCVTTTPIRSIKSSSTFSVPKMVTDIPTARFITPTFESIGDIYVRRRLESAYS